MGSLQLGIQEGTKLKVGSCLQWASWRGDVSFAAFLNFDHHCLELFLMTANKELFTIIKLYFANKKQYAWEK